jgi:ADP-ribose pyrophosphatase
VVHHGGGAGILALNEKGEVALVRQYRYALGREMVEIPAGKVEPWEPPWETAGRELEEECGITADSLVEFGQVVPTCGYCTEIIYLYLATSLHQTGAQNLDEDEFVDVLWLPLNEAAAIVMDGRIDDSKTAVALLKAKALRDAGQL